MRVLLMISVLLLLIQSCGSGNHINSKQLNLKEWNLSNTPSNLYEVGSIIAIDKKGKQVRIPVKLDLKTKTSETHVPSNKTSRLITIEFLIDYLNISSDSALKLSLDYNHKLESEILISNAFITVIDNDNLKRAFEEKLKDIYDNVDFLLLNECKLFIVFEVIQSSEVKISFNRNPSSRLDVSGDIEKITTLAAKGVFQKTENNSLTFNSKSPLTIFFRKQEINSKILTPKGNDSSRILLTLGDIVPFDEY